MEAVTQQGRSQETQTGQSSILLQSLDMVPVTDHSVAEVVDGLDLELVDGGGPPGQGEAEDGGGHGDLTYRGQVVTENSLQQGGDEVGQVGFGRQIQMRIGEYCRYKSQHSGL